MLVLIFSWYLLKQSASSFIFSKFSNLSSVISALFLHNNSRLEWTHAYSSVRISSYCDSRLVALQPALAFRTWTTVAFLCPLSIQLLITKPVRWIWECKQRHRLSVARRMRLQSQAQVCVRVCVCSRFLIATQPNILHAFLHVTPLQSLVLPHIHTISPHGIIPYMVDDIWVQIKSKPQS